MLYKTLHWYILRELLRIFLLTASALTTLMAFGGTFRPLTRQGIEIVQLMSIVIDLMPAMLAYAIPIAALFAAVLVYWRMATDNELTACRASGISFTAIVIPAFILGIFVAVIDLGFVSYVVPRYLQATERAVMRDLGSLIVSQIGRQDVFRYDKWVVYADSAELEDSGDPDKEVVLLRGVSLTGIDPKEPNFVVVARQVTLTIRDIPDQDLSEVTGVVEDGMGFDAASNRAAAPVSTWPPDGQPFLLPSLVKSKPKFLNLQQLATLDQSPTLFPPVREETEKIKLDYEFQQMSQHLYEKWKTAPGGVLTFRRNTVGALDPDEVRLTAPTAVLRGDADPRRQLKFSGNAGSQVRVEQLRDGKVESVYSCDNAELTLSSEDMNGAGALAALQLKDNVHRQDLREALANMPIGNADVSGLNLTPDITHVSAPSEGYELLRLTANDPTPAIQSLHDEALKRIGQLFDSIGSELNSRGSFALSCLTLVLLGAGLGILMQGRNPLAVFVVGFVPAVFLVLLITAGREMAESNHKGFAAGITTIWAGNIFLLALVAGVYVKLFRK